MAPEVVAGPCNNAGRASLLNLILPGGGLIAIGALLPGVLVGLAFAASANFALIAILLFPADFTRAYQALGIGLAVGCYLGAQIRLLTTIRARRRAAAARHRRQQLWHARELLERGEHGAALQVLSSLADTYADDLLVAYRLAQALSLAGSVHAARSAWERVRRLDRHGIYREQTRARLAHPPR